jgi:hypothetical protein
MARQDCAISNKFDFEILALRTFELKGLPCWLSPSALRRALRLRWRSAEAARKASSASPVMLALRLRCDTALGSCDKGRAFAAGVLDGFLTVEIPGR